MPCYDGHDHKYEEYLVTIEAAKELFGFDKKTEVELCAFLRKLYAADVNAFEAIIYNGRNPSARKLADWWDRHRRNDSYEKQRKISIMESTFDDLPPDTNKIIVLETNGCSKARVDRNVFWLTEQTITEFTLPDIEEIFISKYPKEIGHVLIIEINCPFTSYSVVGYRQINSSESAKLFTDVTITPESFSINGLNRCIDKTVSDIINGAIK
jgi:hypothetical protein